MLYRRADEMTWDVTDERAVVLDARGTTLITLNPVGTLLWQHLDEPRDVETLTRCLQERFPEVSEADLREDVADFVSELLVEGLLVEHGPPS